MQGWSEQQMARGLRSIHGNACFVHLDDKTTKDIWRSRPSVLGLRSSLHYNTRRPGWWSSRPVAILIGGRLDLVVTPTNDQPRLHSLPSRSLTAEDLLGIQTMQVSIPTIRGVHPRGAHGSRPGLRRQCVAPSSQQHLIDTVRSRYGKHPPK